MSIDSPYSSTSSAVSELTGAGVGSGLGWGAACMVLISCSICCRRLPKSVFCACKRGTSALYIPCAVRHLCSNVSLLGSSTTGSVGVELGAFSLALSAGITSLNTGVSASTGGTSPSGDVTSSGLLSSLYSCCTASVCLRTCSGTAILRSYRYALSYEVAAHRTMPPSWN